MNKIVVLTGRRKEKLLSAKKLKSRCHIIEHDISKLDSIPSLVSEVEKSIGPINYLINNAGMHLRKIAIETSDQEWKDVIDTNLNSVFSLSRECAKNDPKKKWEYYSCRFSYNYNGPSRCKCICYFKNSVIWSS